jgi:hypothetical protein
LVAIQKRKLYKIDCRTFAAYCKKRFHITSRRAYQLIDASAVAANVNPGSQKTLTSERQARPLTKLDPADQQVVWDEAVETAPNGKVTAKHVEQVVSKRVSDSVPKRVERKEYPPCMAKQFADLAIGQLDHIKPDDAERLQAFDQVEEWIKARRDECP